MEQAEALKTDFEKQVTGHEFQQAHDTLQNLQKLISDSEYQTLTTKLNDEMNKPLETTINRLVSQFGSYKHNFDISGEESMINERVKVAVSFGSVYRQAKSINAYNNKNIGGSSIDIYYSGTNMDDYFTDHEPDKDRYIVTGWVRRYSDADDIYIQAEKIDPVE